MLQPLLITFKACHYCEKARWALDRAGIAYREKWNRPFMEWQPAKPGQVWSMVPRLISEGKTIGGPTPIVRWVDERVAAADRLFPLEPGPKAEVEEWVSLFNKELGPQMRQTIFYLALADRKLLMSFIEHQGGGAFAARWLGLIFPLLAPVARRRMRLTPASLSTSLAKLDAVFHRVGEGLADGRPYLAGNRFTAADLTFASYSATLVAPPGCPAPFPPMGELGQTVRNTVDRYRRTRAGEFVFRIYDEERVRRNESAPRRQQLS